MNFTACVKPDKMSDKHKPFPVFSDVTPKENDNHRKPAPVHANLFPYLIHDQVKFIKDIFTLNDLIYFHFIKAFQARCFCRQKVQFPLKCDARWNTQFSIGKRYFITVSFHREKENALSYTTDQQNETVLRFMKQWFRVKLCWRMTSYPTNLTKAINWPSNKNLKIFQTCPFVRPTNVN